MPPATLTGSNREIGGGPFLNLAEIQACIAAGEIGPDDVWVATKKADDHLYDLQWDTESVCEFIAILAEKDYRKSEWCKSSSNSKHACDVYVVRFDDEDWVRDSRAPEFYIKFSASTTGLAIHLISCHLSED